MIAGIMTDVLVIVLKTAISRHHSVTWFFYLINVLLPIGLLVYKIYDTVTLYKIRLCFKEMLLQDLQSSDSTLRAVSRSQLKHHFGIHSKASDTEQQSLKAPHGSFSRSAMVARDVDLALFDVVDGMKVLEAAGKFKPGEVDALVQPVRQRLLNASVPCFFEVAPPSAIHMTDFGFPHDLGPYFMQPIEISLRLLSKPEVPKPQTRLTSSVPHFSFSRMKTQVMDIDPATWERALEADKDLRIPPNVEWSASVDHFHQTDIANDCAEADVIRGTISALSEVNVSDEFKDEIGIPRVAKYYAWSYPVATGDRLYKSIRRRNRDDLDDLTNKRSTDAFLLSGGFVYFGSDLEIVKVLAFEYKSPEIKDGKHCASFGFQRPIPIVDPGPLAKALKYARKHDTGFPVSVFESGGKQPDLRFMWLSAEQIDSPHPSYGGFLFYSISEEIDSAPAPSYATAYGGTLVRHQGNSIRQWRTAAGLCLRRFSTVMGTRREHAILQA
jgi:hypothetical protein